MNEEDEPRLSGEQLVVTPKCLFYLAGCDLTRIGSRLCKKNATISERSMKAQFKKWKRFKRNHSLEESNDALEQKQKEDEEDIQALERQVRSLEDQLQDAKEELEVVKRKIENLEKEVDDRKQAIVKLELGNDDLERSQSSILDLESKHNRLLEEKILLEEDLLGRERLEEELQRLRDELRDQTLETAYLKSQLEKKQEEIDKLKLETKTLPHENPTPAILRISKSQSSASLSTPPTAVVGQRHTFMSPVPERSMEMEESPGSSSLMTNSTVRGTTADVSGAPFGSPSQIPVARLKRLSGVGVASSPGSPSLRRSNTVDSISRMGSRNSPQQSRSSPLSPRYGTAAAPLNRSTNSRNIASLVLASSSATGSPTPARHTIVQRHASSTSTPLRPVATPRRGSDAGSNSIYAAKRQEISSKTANLVARLQGISAAHKTVVRKTSGGFHRVANAISHHTHTGHGMLARSVSGQGDHADQYYQQQQQGKGQQTGHDVPGGVLGDISTVSTNSPGSWVVVKDRSTTTPDGNIGVSVPLDPESENMGMVSGLRIGDPRTSLSVSTNSRSSKTLPARPGIPSPLNQSVGSKTTTQERSATVTSRRNTRVHQPASNMTVASSNTSESNRSLASLGDGMRVFSRPDSRLSGREAESDDWAGSTVKSPRGGGDDPLPMIAPPPPSGRTHGINGARIASHRRIEPPQPSVSRSNNVLEQAALPPRSSSVQGHHRVPAARPISTRRKTPPPGVNTTAAGGTSATGGGSTIPRRSISGRRPMSMSMVPQDVVPPLPVGALANIEAGRRAAAIGIGLPSGSRRMGGA
ncbi:hypothetical protein QFC22_004435 [Naganishia vaughanmartiniae]|uniref:Uncharacterized protein n=1 Tax=Naganishia vaughanmartiniae TaxID=1424756 RepID=A0ACC2X2H2_9TREE|nr:hypothetical protein QFC22_004435 [Naganishia vaughanmartiniae]